MLLMLVLSLALASPKQCDSIKSHKEFYICSLEKHPKFQASKLRQIEGGAYLEKATQRHNPELSIRSGGGNDGESIGSTESGLNVSLSQMLIRPPKIGIAEADRKIADFEQKMANLMRILTALKQFESKCDGNERVGRCSILDGLNALSRG